MTSMSVRRAALCALAALLLLAAFAGPTAAAGEPSEWGVWRSNVKSMQAAGVKGGTVGDALGAFLDYEYSLPMEFMRRAMVRGEEEGEGEEGEEGGEGEGYLGGEGKREKR